MYSTQYFIFYKHLSLNIGTKRDETKYGSLTIVPLSEMDRKSIVSLLKQKKYAFINFSQSFSAR